MVLQEKKPSSTSLGSGEPQPVRQMRQVRVMVDDNRAKPTTKTKKPIQADRDVIKEFTRSVGG